MYTNGVRTEKKTNDDDDNNNAVDSYIPSWIDNVASASNSSLNRCFSRLYLEVGQDSLLSDPY